MCVGACDYGDVRGRSPELESAGPGRRPRTRGRPVRTPAGYVTGADGRTDIWTTAVVAGVVTGFAVLFVSGLLHVAELFAYPAAVVVGAAVWLILLARRFRAADQRAGRTPDAVATARSQAVAEANGGRRFFVAQNPVVVIVMGGVFLALGVGETRRRRAHRRYGHLTALLAASGGLPHRAGHRHARRQAPGARRRVDVLVRTSTQLMLGVDDSARRGRRG